MYFKRDIDKKLSKHFSQENSTPLIVRGAPDVGKFTSLLHRVCVTFDGAIIARTWGSVKKIHE